MKPKYLQEGFDKQLAHVIEECGEVLAAVCGTLRWGRDSVNPELPPEQRETNEAWLLREMDDLQGAMTRLRAALSAPASRGELVGLYGRPGTREEDGATLATVKCYSGDSDCSFPYCQCPMRGNE